VKIRGIVDRRFTVIAASALLTVCALLILADIASAAERWLCPVCQVERITRTDSTGTFTCPRCKITFERSDLLLSVAYLSVRTRPTEVVWTLTPECGIFREEGLLVYEPKQPDPTLWIPWSAVDYYIPRQRIVRLTSGAEFLTPYAMSPDQCPEPPKFIVTVADSLSDFLGPHTIRTQTKEENLAVMFIIARSPAARDSARVRFISEVMAGKHPRLPRTQPTIQRIATPMVPPSAMNDSVDVVLEARVDEYGQVLKVNRIHGSGNPECDQAALVAARRSSIQPGGEMGAGVPCSVVLTFHFNHGTVTTSGAPAVPPMWREWIEPPTK
jgi:TonB family protein